MRRPNIETGEARDVIRDTAAAPVVFAMAVGAAPYLIQVVEGDRKIRAYVADRVITCPRFTTLNELDEMRTELESRDDTAA